MKNMIRQLRRACLGSLRPRFDRLLFRGILRCVINPRGLNGYLFSANACAWPTSRSIPSR